MFSCSIPFYRRKNAAFSLNKGEKLVRCSYKHRHFENTKLLAGSVTSEDMENIVFCIFSISLSTI